MNVELTPTVNRRREIGAASARSLLLTILGEFARPHHEPVWTATLLKALGKLDIEERAARQAIARTAAKGLLESDRHGRRAFWSLTERGTTLLKEGTERINRFTLELHGWDGHWLVLTVSIPDSQRRLRHRLRTQLTWLGLASPAPGLWVSPDASKATEVHRVISELGLDQQSFAWVGPATGIGAEHRLISSAWDLGEVKDRYLEFVDEFSKRRATTADEAFTAQVELVHAWRLFPYLDPQLPRDLLDDDWPGPRAAAVFHDRHALWHRQAQQEWQRMQTEAATRS